MVVFFPAVPKGFRVYKNLYNKYLLKNVPMDKFFPDPLVEDRVDINFLGQNPFSETVVFLK